MECECQKNQTHPDVLKEMIAKGENPRTALGFGLFLVPAPELGILEWKTVIVEDISYCECARRAENCQAFLWINKGLIVKYTDKDGQRLELAISTKEDIVGLRQRFCVGFCAPPPHFQCGPPGICFAKWGGACDDPEPGSNGTSLALLVPSVSRPVAAAAGFFCARTILL